MAIAKISVVIPTYNAERTLGETLTSVFASDYPEYEVIVVDDGSRDTSRAIARRFPCRVVALEKNAGASRAKNAGAEHATGDIVFFTDSDCVVRPDALRLIAENLADPGVSGVVGLLATELRYGDFASQYKNLWMHLHLPAAAASGRRFLHQRCGGALLGLFSTRRLRR